MARISTSPTQPLPTDPSLACHCAPPFALAGTARNHHIRLLRSAVSIAKMSPLDRFQQVRRPRGNWPAALARLRGDSRYPIAEAPRGDVRALWASPLTRKEMASIIETNALPSRRGVLTR